MNDTLREDIPSESQKDSTEWAHTTLYPAFWVQSMTYPIEGAQSRWKRANLQKMQQSGQDKGERGRRCA